MKHLLLNPPAPGLVLFDDERGEVVGPGPHIDPRESDARESDARSSDARSSDARAGNCYRVGDTWVALYVYAGALFVQVGRKKVALASPSTKLAYGHDWARGLTHLRASDATGAAEVSYPAWWAELGLDPDDVKFVPERDEHEDELAFIYEVWKEPEAQRRLLTIWG